MPDGIQKAADPTIWAEFGLIGLIAFGLFGLVVFLLWQHDKTSRKNTSDTNETLKAISTDHAKERSEWRTTIETSNRETRESHEKMGEAIKELTIAIKTSKGNS